MIQAPKSTKAINSFCYSAIPSPRDVFAKYGARQNAQGEFSTSVDEYGDPALVGSSSRIDQILNADAMLRAELEKQKEKEEKK